MNTALSRLYFVRAKPTYCSQSTDSFFLPRPLPLLLPHCCPYTDAILSTQEAPATWCSTVTLLCLFPGRWWWWSKIVNNKDLFFLEKLGLLDFTDRGKKLKWMYCCCRRKVNEENLPISLELVIKSELCPSIYNFSGKEANSELTIHCPLWKTTTTRTLQTTWEFILTPHVQMKRCYTNTKTLIRLLNYFKLSILVQHWPSEFHSWAHSCGS